MTTTETRPLVRQRRSNWLEPSDRRWALSICNGFTYPVHHRLAHQLARAVTEHATPVGSGTVARTKRISLEQRAEAAVIAWMRHQTTAYDSMSIPRVRGKRREVRRMLAQRSKKLLSQYRLGTEATKTCPLYQALTKSQTAPS